MSALVLAMLLAGGPAPAGAPDETDLRCYRLMADLAHAEDPQVRTLGITAASFFVGRIDAASPGYDLTQVARVSDSERPELVRLCGDALGTGGFDVRSLGRSLAGPEPTI